MYQKLQYLTRRCISCRFFFYLMCYVFLYEIPSQEHQACSIQFGFQNQHHRGGQEGVWFSERVSGPADCRKSWQIWNSVRACKHCKSSTHTCIYFIIFFFFLLFLVKETSGILLFGPSFRAGLRKLGPKNNIPEVSITKKKAKNHESRKSPILYYMHLCVLSPSNKVAKNIIAR